MKESYLDLMDKFEIASKATLKEENYRVGHIIGLGANILNGYSYEQLEGHLIYLCDCAELHNLTNGISKLVYIENYKEPDFGFENCVSTPERTICDFLMYPKELEKDFWLLDAIEGYYEEYGNFDKVYEMLNHFGISHTKFDEYVEVAEI